MIHKTEAEIGFMKEAATLVSKTLTEVATLLKPGMTTLQIDKICADFVIIAAILIKYVLQ